MSSENLLIASGIVMFFMAFAATLTAPLSASQNIQVRVTGVEALTQSPVMGVAPDAGFLAMGHMTSLTNG